MWRGDLAQAEQHKDYERNHIVAEDYIIYMDMIYNGTQEEKNKISFMMVDVTGDGKVFFDDYRNFWIKFLEMYGELLQMKTIYNEETEFITKDYFSKIVKVNGDPKRDFTNENQQYFTIDDFNEAREQHPEIFEWIEFPDKRWKEIEIETLLLCFRFVLTRQ